MDAHRVFGSAASFASVVAVALSIGASGAQAAKPSSPPLEVWAEFGAGTACDFPLRLEGSENPKLVVNEFFNKDGELARMLFAGQSNEMLFTNMDTNATFAKRTLGVSETVTFNSDGTETWEVRGHAIQIYLPTDAPAGPSTVLHIGRFVFTVEYLDEDPYAVATEQSSSGRTIDICAALSE